MDHLLSYDVPVIFVGDMGQLEPIGDDPNLMANPRIVLRQIHRQAQDSPIIEFSRKVRTGEDFDYTEGDKLRIIDAQLNNAMDFAPDVDQVICGFNNTRQWLNGEIRDYKGFQGQLVVGDKMVCLRNNVLLGVFNGMLATVEKIHDRLKSAYICDMRTDDDRLLERLNISTALIGSKSMPENFRAEKGETYWTYGYALTCHKCQGSEWENTLVIHEIHPNWSQARWAYTAITRASDKLIYMI